MFFKPLTPCPMLSKTCPIISKTCSMFEKHNSMLDILKHMPNLRANVHYYMMEDDEGGLMKDNGG
jgi:hypothetical protein